ncbi:hypothetical protein AN216_11755, partial [Streptomyces oceani]
TAAQPRHAGENGSGGAHGHPEAPAPDQVPTAPPSSGVTVPVGPNRVRALGGSTPEQTGPEDPGPGQAPQFEQASQGHQQLFLEPQQLQQPATSDAEAAHYGRYEPAVAYEPEAPPEPEIPPAPEVPYEPNDPDSVEPVGIPDGVPREEVYFRAYRDYAAVRASFPSARQLSRALHEGYGITDADGSLLSETYLRSYLHELRDRYNTEMGLAG